MISSNNLEHDDTIIDHQYVVENDKEFYVYDNRCNACINYQKNIDIILTKIGIDIDYFDKSGRLQLYNLLNNTEKIKDILKKLELKSFW